jgi:Zn-dependent protease with chaperone function
LNAVLWLLLISGLVLAAVQVSLRLLSPERLELRQSLLVAGLIGPVLFIPFTHAGILEVCGRLLHQLVEMVPTGPGGGLIIRLLMASLLLALGATTAILRYQRRLLAREGPQHERRAEAEDLLRSLSRRAGIALPRLHLTGRPVGAAVTGVRRPAMVLSSHLLDVLGHEELEAVVAHEVAHIRRRDVLLKWIIRAFAATFAWLPTSWVLPRLLDREREKACDDFAVTLTGKPLALAEALVVLWQSRAPGLRGGLAVTAGALEERIARLLHGRRTARTERPWLPLILGPVFALVLGVVGVAEVHAHGLFSAASQPVETGAACPHPDR